MDHAIDYRAGWVDHAVETIRRYDFVESVVIDGVLSRRDIVAVTIKFADVDQDQRFRVFRRARRAYQYARRQCPAYEVDSKYRVNGFVVVAYRPSIRYIGNVIPPGVMGDPINPYVLTATTTTTDSSIV